MEQLLLEAEKTLVNVASILTLIRQADYDEFYYEIDDLLQLSAEMAEDIRQKITSQLILMQIKRQGKDSPAVDTRSIVYQQSCP